jgi:hypothetical protein
VQKSLTSLTTLTTPLSPERRQAFITSLVVGSAVFDVGASLRHQVLQRASAAGRMIMRNAWGDGRIGMIF